jgi:hypothetical protein
VKITDYQFQQPGKNMKPIKDTILNLFSTNKKKDKGVSLEIENEPQTKEDNEHKTDVTDDSKSMENEEHETEFKHETIITEDEDIAADSEWEKRVLCSDGNCIGVIGPDGRCRECGKAYNSESEQIYDHDDNDQDISETLQEDKELISDEQDFFPGNQEEFIKTSDESTAEGSETTLESESESEWDNRTLCSDGHCIGVIGPDGRCKECGKPYEE